MLRQILWGIIGLASIVLALYFLGCRPTFAVNLSSDPPNVRAWRSTISERVNQHEDRLTTVEEMLNVERSSESGTDSPSGVTILHR